MLNITIRSLLQAEVMIKDALNNLEPDLDIISKEGAIIQTNKFLLSQFSPILRSILDTDKPSSPSLLHLPDVTAPALIHLLSVIKNGVTSGSGSGYSIIKQVRDVAQVLGFDNIPVLTFVVQTQLQPQEEEDLAQNVPAGSSEICMRKEVSAEAEGVDRMEIENNEYENATNIGECANSVNMNESHSTCLNAIISKSFPMSAKTSLLASRTRNDPCQILPGDSNSWGEAFLDNVDDVATWANHKKTKVLIISQKLNMDRNYVENELKRNEKTNKIIFHYYEIGDPKGTVHDQESFIHMFEEVGPTVVVLAYQHMIKADVNNKLNPKRSGYAPPGSVAEILNSKKYFSKILLSHSNYLILRTSNVWHREECILTSLSPITKRGVKSQLKEARRSGLLDNSPDSRVVIISGGHGCQQKDGRVTSAGGESCFSNKDFLDLKFYEQDVEAIRELRKDPDFDKVCFEVVNIEDYGIYKSKPKQSKLSKLLSRTFRLDTSSSNTNSMYRQSSAGKLVSYLTEFRPTFILISWCFSTNGDLAMALRSRGFFSKLLMEHDLRNITKDPEAKLSDQQVEVLREAAATDPGGKKPKYKNFHLVGSSGCGKTILELEIGKIILAQICRDLQPGENVNVCIMVPKCMTKVPSELIKKLEDDLSFKDLVSAYAVNQKNVQLDYCDSIQELSQRIKDEISEMPPAKYTVIIADEVTIEAEEVNGELVQDFTSLDRMEDNVWCVYAHSPVDESMITSNEIAFKIKLPLCTDVYTQHLHTRYRNNPEILQFLKFYVGENQDRTLVVDNDHDGARLPPGLAGSQQHPVLWLDCNWSWVDIGRNGDGDTQLTKEMVHSLVPDIEVFNPNKNTSVGVMVVPLGGVINKEASQHWRWMYWSTCAGMEEEIVVIVTGHLLRFEALSRARNQLIIVTGTDLIEGLRALLVKAEGKNLLEKVVINDKPDAIIG